MYTVSIIIPVYKVEKYIEECLVSIFDQLPDHVQVILINDGSPDRSFDIAKSVIVRYKESIQKQVLLINQSNKGLSCARNTGIDNALGKYIGFLDSDDKLLPGYFDSILKVLDNNNYDIIDFNFLTSDHEEKLIRQGHFEYFSNNSVFYAGLWYSWARIINKDLLIKHKFTSGIYYEDLALIPILYIRAKNIIHIKEAIYWYRLNQNGITLSQSKANSGKTIESFEIIIEQYLKLYEEEKNQHIISTIMQIYYLLCTSACVRLNLFQSFKFVKAYKARLDKLGFEQLLRNNLTVHKKLYYFYLYPYPYLSLLCLGIYTRDKYRLIKGR